MAGVELRKLLPSSVHWGGELGNAMGKLPALLPGWSRVLLVRHGESTSNSSKILS